MIPKDILDSLPVKYYVIDIIKRVIVKSNDNAVSSGQRSCFLSIFNSKDSCQREDGTCFCKLLAEKKEFEYIVESGPRRSKKHYKADVKRINDQFSVATFTEVTQLMASEKEIRINNKRLMRAENLVSFGSWEIDVKTNRLYATDGAFKIYGIGKKELLFSDVSHVPLPEYREMIERALKDLIAGRNNYNIRFKIRRHSDGAIRNIHSVAEYREDKNLVFGIIRDTTEFEENQNALRDSLADLKMAQKIARLGNWKYDPVTKDIFISGQINAIFGGSEIRDKLSLHDFEKFAGDEDQRILMELTNKAVQKGIGFKKQFQIQLENGKEKWIEIICQPDQDKRAGPYGLRGIIKDITESKLAEIELRDSNNLFRTLIQNMPDAMYMKDTSARKIIANQEDIKNCGLEHEEQVLGKTDFEIYPEEVAQKFYDDDMLVLKKGMYILNREEELPGNPKRWILTSKIPLKDQKGNITGLVGVGHDITSRKKMIEELNDAKLKAEESDRLKSVFLANMSHEIRTPLNGIIGFTNLICSNGADPELYSTYAQIIEQCGLRLTSLIDDIIDISIIQSNQLKLSYSRFYVSDLLMELYTFYRNVRKDQLNHIQFRFREIPKVQDVGFYSDRQRIYQVLKNLIDNAIKFTHKGYIEFGCYKTGTNELTFYVEDTGIGIDAGKKEIIFDNFRQAEEGLSRHYEGVGLGLPIVSGIVQQLGGTIKIDSEAGKGSVFYVTIPAVDENKEIELQAGNHLARFSPVNINSERKLIISFEDDPASITYLESVTKSFGCAFYNFTDPLQGIEYIRRNKPNLVFMDVRLPGMSGLEATQIIKSEFPDLPVVVQSAGAMRTDKKLAMDSGCNAYLTKPVSLNILKETITKYLINDKR